MSETRDPRDLGSAAPRDGPEPKTEYQPPAIAWEEPIEAVAALSCALADLQCDETGGSVS
jgi:hypothetical protein